MPWYTFARAASSVEPISSAISGYGPVQHVPMHHRDPLARGNVRTASHSASSGVGSTAVVARSGGSAVGSAERARDR